MLFVVESLWIVKGGIAIKMRLDKKGLQDIEAWKAAGYHVPTYDREKLTENTKQKPEWIHFGAGNIFRAYQANLMQQLMEEGKSDTGLIVAEGFDYEGLLEGK